MLFMHGQVRRGFVHVMHPWYASTKVPCMLPTAVLQNRFYLILQGPVTKAEVMN